jgi:hypothetical protein
VTKFFANPQDYQVFHHYKVQQKPSQQVFFSAKQVAEIKTSQRISRSLKKFYCHEHFPGPDDEYNAYAAYHYAPFAYADVDEDDDNPVRAAGRCRPARDAATRDYLVELALALGRDCVDFDRDGMLIENKNK